MIHILWRKFSHWNCSLSLNHYQSKNNTIPTQYECVLIQTEARQIGHVGFVINHLSTQGAWNSWAHGNTRNFSSTSYSDIHTTQRSFSLNSSKVFFVTWYEGSLSNSRCESPLGSLLCDGFCCSTTSRSSRNKGGTNSWRWISTGTPLEGRWCQGKCMCEVYET